MPRTCRRWVESTEARLKATTSTQPESGVRQPTQVAPFCRSARVEHLRMATAPGRLRSYRCRAGQPSRISSGSSRRNRRSSTTSRRSGVRRRRERCTCPGRGRSRSAESGRETRSLRSGGRASHWSRSPHARTTTDPVASRGSPRARDAQSRPATSRGAPRTRPWRRRPTGHHGVVVEHHIGRHKWSNDEPVADEPVRWLDPVISEAHTRA